MAIGVLNRWAEGTPIRVQVTLKSLGLTNVGGYAAKDVFSGASLGTFSPEDTITLDVNPTSKVNLVACTGISPRGVCLKGGNSLFSL